MTKLTFITQAHSIAVLRIVTGLIFIAHAVVRIFGSTMDRFAQFLESKGFIPGVFIVWVLTIYEIVAGLLVVTGVFTRWLAFGFILIIVVGIIIIHFDNGLFVGEHGTGGMEYSMLLLAALVVVAVSDKK